jgi:hypothetical protein
MMKKKKMKEIGLEMEKIKKEKKKVNNFKNLIHQ